ncbi:hypothetical protein [Ureibacillus manganicus]|uniref:hypothetical protein n=1 Tax=Ureibacillus manganicus TaxID=1266064 RepID=UPI00068E54FD|nr:hypothetical protein [Ureibacillus manganicus]
MAHVPIEAVPTLEAAIYLPMVLDVLDNDFAVIDAGEFKLKYRYFHLIDKARNNVHEDFKKTKAYLHRHQLKVVRGNSDELFTEYYFHYQQAMEVRRYSNIRLRNKIENLLEYYFKHALYEVKEVWHSE